MKIHTDTSKNETILTYHEEDLVTGSIVLIERTFTVAGSYVMERVDGEWRQVCRKLEATGSTLTLKEGLSLADLIRKEFRALQRKDAKSEYPRLKTSRRSPGRPKEISQGKNASVYLDDITLDMARKIGDGNLSQGIRKAVESYPMMDEVNDG